MGSENLCNVMIADSQFLIVEAVKSLLQKEGRFRISGVAASNDELFKLVQTARPDLLIADFANLGDDGTEVLKNIRELEPHLRILVLTTSILKGEFNTFTRQGIKNIIYKSADKEEFFSAIDATLKGKKFYSDEILDQFLDTSEKKPVTDPEKNLTFSEIEIIKMIADGLTTKEIAFRRNISYHTVSTHRKNIFRKTEVSNASELIIYAIKAGLINNIEYYI